MIDVLEAGVFYVGTLQIGIKCHPLFRATDLRRIVVGQLNCVELIVTTLSQKKFYFLVEVTSIDEF